MVRWRCTFLSSELLEVRDALLGDAGEAAEVLVRSITHLCHDDHQDDPDRIAHWTRNKMPETVARWISDPTLLTLVAVEGTRVVAIGGARRPDHILLNYVDPSCRLRGASTLLMAELELSLIHI